MAIEIGFYNEDTDELEEAEELVGSFEFFYFAEVLSKIMDVAVSSDDPGTKDFQQAFLDYINEDREESLDRFAGYCDFIAEGVDAVVEQAREESETPGEAEVVRLDGGKVVKPRLEDFDPDTQAFLGRLIIGDEPVRQPEAGNVFKALVWIGIILKYHILSLEQENPEVLPHLEFARDVIASIAGFCEETVESGRPFRIAC